VREGLNLVYLVALTLLFAPPTLVGLAWRSIRKDSESLVGWRRQGFWRALVGSSLNTAVGLVFFFVHNFVLADSARVSFSVLLVERVVEWAGAIFAVVFFVLAFSGTGKARIYVVLAAFFNFYVWAATL
jgi:hypothetical protein